MDKINTMQRCKTLVDRYHLDFVGKLRYDLNDYLDSYQRELIVQNIVDLYIYADKHNNLVVFNGRENITGYCNNISNSKVPLDMFIANSLKQLHKKVLRENIINSLLK